MKFALATVALAAVAAAGPVDDALKGINADITALDTAVKSYSGDKGPLVQAAQKLINDVKAATTSIGGGPDLTQAEALPLVPVVTQINKDGKQLSDDLISKKDEVQKAKECSTVRGIATDLTSSSKDLIKAVVSKTPSDLQAIAQNLASELTKTLQTAQDAFSEANCKDASGGGSTPSGSSKPSGSAPASSSAPSNSAPVGTVSASSSGGAKPTGSATQSGPATVPTGAAGALAPGALVAAAVAALAL